MINNWFNGTQTDLQASTFAALQMKRDSGHSTIDTKLRN